MPIPLMAGLAVGGGLLKLGGSLFGGKSKEQLEAEAQKKAWDANEVQRVKRCQNISNWFKQKAAQAGKPLPPEQAKTDNCPPPQPYAHTVNQGGPGTLSKLMTGLGGGVQDYAKGMYGASTASSAQSLGTPRLLGTLMPNVLEK